MDGGELLSPSVWLNSAIIGVVGIITLLLQRKFSKRDTVTSLMAKENRRLRIENAHQRRVISIVDQEAMAVRRLAAGAGVILDPRPEWPPPPEEEPLTVTPVGD